MNPDLAHEFNRAYYDSEVWWQTSWLGVPTLKAPTDLWIYQELLAEIRPALIVECGTYKGGSALFLASICELLRYGHVVSIDVDATYARPAHARVTYLTGSTIDPQIVTSVREMLPADGRCMVILDSDHQRDHVLAELECYAPMVSIDSYLIVEDTNVNGNPVLPDFGPGPMEAVKAFLAKRSDFEIDRAREKFGLTFNPSGYLKRIERESVD